MNNPTPWRDWYEIKAQKGAADAEILIYGDIGDSWSEEESVTAKKLVAELNALDVDDLSVRVNSYGGIVADAIAIYNALRRHKAQVAVSIDGVAFSAASMIAMAGDVIGMAKNALLMIHAPWGMAMGNANDMRDTADILDKYAQAMANAYERKPDFTRDDALALLSDGADHFFTAQEAGDMGLIDAIIDEPESPRAAAMRLEAFARYRPTENTYKPNPVEDSMTTEQKDIEPNQAQISSIEDAALKKERERIASRNAELEDTFGLFMKPGHPHAEIAGEIYRAALADPMASVDKARADLLAKIGAANAEPIGGGFAPQTIPGGDVRDKLRIGISAVLAHRMGLGKDDRENQFRGMSLSLLARECLVAAGHSVRGMTASDLAGKVLAAHTTSDFPFLLMDAANKRLQAAYGAFPSTWRSIALAGETTDFKTVNLIRMGSFNSLDVIPEGMQYTQGTIGEEREQLTPVTKGKYIQLSRQMIVNDDLNGFNRMAMLLGRAAARTVNADVYSVLNDNAALSDGIELFHASHNNLAGSGGAINVATISAGRAAMRKQTAPGSNATEYLNIMPTVLACPVVLEDHANSVVLSEYNTDELASRKRNPMRNWGPLTIVSDPYLDAASVTAWYLIADPMDAPVVEVRFLDGVETPYLDTNEEFLTDAVQWKVRLDYGFTGNDFRGGYKNPGA